MRLQMQFFKGSKLKLIRMLVMLSVLSSLFLSGLSSLPVARAATTTIIDQDSCQNAGGLWSLDSCGFNSSITIGADDTWIIQDLVTVNFNGTVTNNGSLTISENATAHFGTVTNNGSLTILRSVAAYFGTFTNNGALTFFDNSLSYLGATFNNNKGATLTMHDASVLFGGGSLINAGTINIVDTSFFNNSGPISNQGTITVSCEGIFIATVSGNPPQYACSAPTSSATTTPSSPNANGWYNQNVTINLSAANNSSSGVNSITYSASGNQTIPSTTVSGSSASFTINTEGTTTISYNATDNNGNKETTKTLTVKLDKTAPTATATPDRAPNANGWYNASVSFSFSGVDTAGGSGNVTCDAPKTYSGPDSATASVTGNCTDAAGNSASATATFKYDATLPTITASAKTADGQPYTAGTWTNQAVTVSFSCSDTTSGLDGSCPADQIYSTSGTYTVSGSVSDKAGNSATATLQIKIDQTAPTASPTQSPAPNPNGWNNTDVIVSWNWTDNAGGSGIDAANCTITTTSSGEGSLNLTATCKDLSGSLGNASYTVKVDKTAPIGVIGTAERAPDAGGYYNHSVKVIFSGTDASSGIDSCTSSTYSGPDSNSATVSGSCTDKAGNSASGTFSLKYDATKPTTLATLPTATNGFYNSNITVSLDASDNLSGVKSITYSLNGGTPTIVSAATTRITISTEGSTTLSFFATDNAGNVENSQTQVVKVDKTMPEFDLYFDKDSRQLILKTVDALSGVATAPIALPSSTINNPAPYELKDTAGNSLKVYFRRITSNNGDTFVGVEFKKLEYSNGTVLNLDSPYKENAFKVEYEPKTGQPLKNAEQSFSLQGVFNVVANYNATKNQTRITIKEQGLAAVNRTDSGLTLLHAISNKGKLTFKVGN